MVNPGANSSYANLVRPTFFQAGKYLNYSVQFTPNTDIVRTSTNLSGYLNYAVTSVGAQYYIINETTSRLHVDYGSVNTNRTMGIYPISTSRATIDLETWRAYSSTSHIKASTYNFTNLTPLRTFSTTLNMYKTNGSFASASGNMTSAMILDSMLPLSNTNRFYYYTHYLALLSYYKSLNCLCIDPKGLYAPNITTAAGVLSYNGTGDISTFLGTRSTVCFSIMNSTYLWQQFLYFDMYTGILLKAVFKYDLQGKIYAHQLVYQLISTNVNFGTTIPLAVDEFGNVLTEVKTYLAKSALNDTNSSLFNHAAVGESSTLVNKSKVTADLFKVLMGYTEAFGPSLSGMLGELNASALHDMVNGAFYQSMNPAGIPSSVKTVSDAAWAILGTEQFSNMSKFQQEMFNFMKLLYTNGTTEAGSKFWAFTRTNATNNMFYASDNLLAALALNYLGLRPTDNFWTTQDEASAQNMSYYIISLFSGNPAFPSFWDLNYGLFVTSIAKTGKIYSGITDKNIIDACMAIVALGEYYLYNQTTTGPYSSVRCVDRAVLTFNDLLGSAAWNKTNKGFDHQLASSLSINDGNQYLEDNAWAMLASVDLLEAANKELNKKNITYYDVACDIWACIKSQLHDATNKTYITAVNNRKTVAGDLGILLSALACMHTLSNSTSLSPPVMNASSYTYIFEEQHTAQASVTWTFNVARTLQVAGRALSSVNIQIPLNYSDVNFFIRYGNDTIYNHALSVTDNTGTATFQFPLPVPPVFYDQFPSTTYRFNEFHVVSAAANRTGFIPVTNVNAYRILSNTFVEWNRSDPYVQFNFSNSRSLQTVFTSVQTLIPEVYPGQAFKVSMNMSNDHAFKQTVNVTFNSSILQRFSALQVLNASSQNKTYTFSLIAGNNIPLGVQNISCTVSKNGSTLYTSYIKFFVKTPLVISYINYSRYIVDNGSNYLEFTVKNINVNRDETVTAKFSSVNLVLVSGLPSLVIPNIHPNQEVSVNIAFMLASNASKLTTYQFSLELIWDNQSLGVNTYQVPFQAPIELVSITGPSQPTQGVSMWFSISIQNNRQTNVQVSIQLIRIMSDGTPSILASFNRTLTPGLNNILYKYANDASNPFDVGQREYLVVVHSSGNEIGRGTVIANVQTSIVTIIFGYVLVFAIIGAVLLLAVYKKRQFSSIRK